MIKILSWKINSGVYAYIYPVNDGKYISNRIPEDSPLWESVIDVIKDWDITDYKNSFDAMNKEVESKYGKTIEWSENYFTSGNTGKNTNIVLLSGKDGVGVAGEGEKTDSNIDNDTIDEFIQEIENKLDKAREEIEKKNEEVENFIEEKVSQTIANAQKTIDKTKEELSIVREELTEGLNSAKDALKKASDLFDFNGEITQEDIIGAVSTTKEYGGWLSANTDNLTDLKADYDKASGKLGSIGEAENVVDGFFSKMAVSINTVNETVGNVESTMNASLGEIKDMATWYDTNKDSATEAIRLISASGAQIQDVVTHIGGSDYTAKLINEMDAKDATIRSEIMAQTTDAVTNVRRDMNALSGTIEDTIVRLSDETLTSMGDRMNALDFEMEKWMTQFNELCGTTVDMRETWTAQSGMLSTVASLTAELDENGDVKFYVSAGTSGVYDPPIVVKRIDDGNGGYYYLHEGTNTKFTEAYTKLSTQMASYIQQEISGITLSVVNGEGLTAAIKLAITETPEGDEEPIITMIAKEVVIDANVIAKEIESKRATLGGIVMDNGLCYSLAKNTSGEPLFKLDGTNGTIYAENGEFSGKINATSGKIGGIEIKTSSLSATNFSVTSEGVVVANDIIINGGKLFGNNVEEDKLIFKDKDGNTVLYIGSVDKNEDGGKDPVMCGGFKDKKIGVLKFTYTDGSVSKSMYSTFIQPPAFEDILLGNNNKIDLGNNGIFIKGHGLILGPELMGTKLRYYDETNGYLIGILSSSTSSEFCILQETTNSWGSKDYRVFKRDKSSSNHVISVDDFASFKDVIDFADLLIYDDGSIESDYVTFNNGLFKGEIDSDGIFKGSLSGANGSINNVTITNSIINKSLYVDEVLNVNSDYDNIFNTQYFSTEYSFYEQNKTKKSVTYSNSEEIVLINEKNVNGSAIDVEIEEISGFIHRFIPYNRQASSASVIVTISGLNNIKFGNDNKTSVDGKFTYTQNELKSKGKHRTEFKTTKIKGILPASGNLKITLSYKIPAANKYGASYGSAWVSVNKMRIFFDTKSKGLSINRNGFLYNSPNGKNGIEVTDDGIFFYLNNKKYSLNTSYLTETNG
jgi:hypothetical protein